VVGDGIVVDRHAKLLLPRDVAINCGYGTSIVAFWTAT
jgi:hypothetical protein